MSADTELTRCRDPSHRAEDICEARRASRPGRHGWYAYDFKGRATGRRKGVVRTANGKNQVSEGVLLGRIV